MPLTSIKSINVKYIQYLFKKKVSYCKYLRSREKQLMSQSILYEKLPYSMTTTDILKLHNILRNIILCFFNLE